MNVVEAEGHGGYEALQRDLDGQAKVLLQQGAGECPHRFWLLEIHPGGDDNDDVAVSLGRVGIQPIKLQWGIYGMISLARLVVVSTGAYLVPGVSNLVPAFLRFEKNQKGNF